MGRRRWALVAWIAGFACAGTPESGQTGSAACARPADCPCDVLGGRALLEASVVRSSEASVTVEVIRVLSVPPDDSANAAGAGGERLPAAGDLLSGTPSWICGGSTSLLEPGAHVLVTGLHEEVLWLVPWGDKFDSGGGLDLSIDELSELTDYATCYSRFLPQHDVACNDTPSYSTQSSSCAMARSAR